MLSKRDIRAIMLYEFKRDTNAAKTTQEFNETFGEDLISHATVKRWFKKFREGSEDLENEKRGRAETVLDNDELRKAVEVNPRETVRKLAEELNVSKTTISDHLKEKGKSKKLDKWVLHELNDYQKLRTKSDPFFDRLNTCDEKWILYDNRKRSGQWLDKDEASKQFPKLKLSPKKLMKLCELGYESLPHPPYSPDLSPTDCHFFKHLNNFLTEKVFRNDEDIKTASEAFIEFRSQVFYVTEINKLVGNNV
uniref:HTH_48 domain-containing protein n=1 Tax=Strongyloides papillosus TaxID=174720 RepID=A0A0N5BEU6_STREA